MDLFISVNLCMDAKRILNLSSQFTRRISATQEMFGFISLEHIARSQYHFPYIMSENKFKPKQIMPDKKE